MIRLYFNATKKIWGEEEELLVFLKMVKAIVKEYWERILVEKSEISKMKFKLQPITRGIHNESK